MSCGFTITGGWKTPPVGIGELPAFPPNGALNTGVVGTGGPCAFGLNGGVPPTLMCPSGSDEPKITAPRPGLKIETTTPASLRRKPNRPSPDGSVKSIGSPFTYAYA